MTGRTGRDGDARKYKNGMDARLFFGFWAPPEPAVNISVNDKPGSQFLVFPAQLLFRNKCIHNSYKGRDYHNWTVTTRKPQSIP